MQEKRCVRFSNIGELGRADVAVAGEIWLRDLGGASWATREVMRLATHLVRYMVQPDDTIVSFEQIESQCQLGRDDVLKALAMMRNYGFADAFTFDDARLKVALHLSILQRFETLDLTDRYVDFVERRRKSPKLVHSSSAGTWLPKRMAPEGGRSRKMLPVN